MTDSGARAPKSLTNRWLEKKALMQVAARYTTMTGAR